MTEFLAPFFSGKSWSEAWRTAFSNGAALQGFGPDPESRGWLLGTTSTVFGVRLGALVSPTNDHAGSYDWAGSRNEPEAVSFVAREMEDLLKSGKIDLLEVDHVPEGSFLSGVFKILRKRGCPVEASPSQETPLVDLELGWEPYLQGRSSKFRGNFRKAERRVDSAGIRMIEVAGEEDWPHWLHRAWEIEGAGWKGTAGTAIQNQADVRGFYESVLGKAREEGRLGLYYLMMDDTPIAFNMVIRDRDTFIGWKSSFLEEHSKFSPGLVLLGWVIQDLMGRRSLRWLDMSPPASGYKMRWATSVEALFRYRAFGQTPRGLTAYGLSRVNLLYRSGGRLGKRLLRAVRSAGQRWRK